ILSDTSLATRIEAFDEPDLSKLMVNPKPDLTPRQTFKPYPIDQITQHVPPGTRILDGKYPLLAGLEHDEMGHPTGSPKLHMAFTASANSPRFCAVAIVNRKSRASPRPTGSRSG